MKLARFSAKLVANFRRSLEGDFRASFAGENRQKHLHQNSTANSTIKLRYEVLGCGGPYTFSVPDICSISHWLGSSTNSCATGANLGSTKTKQPQRPLSKGEPFLFTVGAFLLTVKLLCLQSLKALIRHTSHSKQKSSNCT